MITAALPGKLRAAEAYLFEEGILYALDARERVAVSASDLYEGHWMFQEQRPVPRIPISSSYPGTTVRLGERPLWSDDLPLALHHEDERLVLIALDYSFTRLAVYHDDEWHAGRRHSPRLVIGPPDYSLFTAVPDVGVIGPRSRASSLST